MPNLKITQLTEDASPTSDDLIVTVNNPSGTPASRKVTLANAITKASGLSNGMMSVRSSVLTTSDESTVYGLNFDFGTSYAPPASLPTAADSGIAGNPNGTYYYTVSFYNASGETVISTATPTPVTVVSKQVTLTNIPTSSDSRIIGRRIYRNKAVDGTVTAFVRQWRVATIADNTSTTYTDNIADASLTVQVLRISTLKDYFTSSSVRVANFNSLSIAQGYNAMLTGGGYACTAIGGNTLTSNINGERNTAIGVFALYLNTSGFENTAIGVHALNNVVDKSGSTAIGYAAGINWTGTTSNDRITAVGAYCLNSATTNAGHTGIGYQALQLNTTGYNNTGIGESAGRGNTTGASNTYIGYQAGYIVDSNFNVAVGQQALNAAAGAANTCVGVLSGGSTTGGNNVHIGFGAGQYETAGSTFYVDSYGRSNLADQQGKAILYGTIASAAVDQRLTSNALFRPVSLTTASRPAWASGLKGYIYFDTTLNKMVVAGNAAWETITSV